MFSKQTGIISKLWHIHSMEISKPLKIKAMIIHQH